MCFFKLILVMVTDYDNNKLNKCVDFIPRRLIGILGFLRLVFIIKK